MDSKLWLALIQAIGTLIVGLGAIWVAFQLYGERNRKLQRVLEAGKRRLNAYALLWDVTRADLSSGHPAVPPKRRAILREKMTAVYYTDGAGMLFSPQVSKMFLVIRSNLHVPDAEFAPCSWQSYLQGRDGRDLALGRQLSLLRTQMKLELNVYEGGKISADPVHPLDRFFLRHCNVPDDDEIWRNAPGKDGLPPWAAKVCGRRR